MKRSILTALLAGAALAAGAQTDKKMTQEEKVRIDKALTAQLSAKPATMK